MYAMIDNCQLLFLLFELLLGNVLLFEILLNANREITIMTEVYYLKNVIRMRRDANTWNNWCNYCIVIHWNDVLKNNMLL